MSTRSVFLAFSVGSALALIALFLLGASVESAFGKEAGAVQADLHVCQSGCPYKSVQAAVDAAEDGDVIKVASGFYTGVSTRNGFPQMVYLTRTLTIQGGFTTTNWITPDPDTNLTTLDAQGLGRVFFIAGQGCPTISGLRITGGNALGLGPDDVGGGILVHNDMYAGRPLTFIDNTIFENTAWKGGGAYFSNHGSGYTISGNTIVSNTAGELGGGLILSSNIYTLTNNLIAGNTADRGGGLAELNRSDAILQSNTLRGNSAGLAGGGFYIENSMAKLDANVVVDNTAGRGGGLAVLGYPNSWQRNEFANILIANNQASVEGSGVYVAGAHIQMSHTTLANNTGGDGSGLVIGDWNPSGSTETSIVDMWNTILADQSIGLNVSDASNAVMDGVLWFNTSITVTQVPAAGVVVKHQLMGDPGFTNPGSGNYHIGAASAARDAGIDAGTRSDLDSDVRPMGFGFDLGADEFQEAGLSVLNTSSLAGANVNEQMLYALQMTSSGSQDTHNVVLTATVDANQRLVQTQPPAANCTITDIGWGGQAVCALGDLAAGDTVLISVTVQTLADVPLGQPMTDTLEARADEAYRVTHTVVYAQDCHVRIGEEVDQYTSVQAAVNEAAVDSMVKVAGTCMGVRGAEGARQQVLVNKRLTIQGGFTTSNWVSPDPDANLTTLDARGLGRVFYISTSELGPMIAGLNISGGNSLGQMGGHHATERNGSRGGGIYCYGSDPMLVENHIFENIGSEGGGMEASFCNPTILRTTFSDNLALEYGGGLAVHANGSTLVDCLFEANSSERGGGFAAAAAGGGDFTRCTFTGNQAEAVGGGLFLEQAAWLHETVIISNTASYGGGIAFSDWISPFSPFAEIINSVIAGNQASQDGAGVFISPGNTVHLVHTTIANNLGGEGSGVTLGPYEWQNPGTSTVIMTNTILANQTIGLEVKDTSVLTVTGILWYTVATPVDQAPGSMVAVNDQSFGDPAFTNPASADYHIGEDSVARDAGVTSAVSIDMDGETRPSGPGYDLGADEYFVPEYITYLPVITR